MKPCEGQMDVSGVEAKDRMLVNLGHAAQMLDDGMICSYNTIQYTLKSFIARRSTISTVQEDTLIDDRVRKWMMQVEGSSTLRCTCYW